MKTWQVGVTAGIIVFLTVGVIAEMSQRRTLEREAIERGCAGYNVTTGVWEWRDGPHGAERVIANAQGGR